MALAAAGVLTFRAAFDRRREIHIEWGEDFHPDRAIIRQAAHLGVPYIAERATINLGQVAMTFVVAKLGTVALAANHIATTAEGLCYLPAYGISFAATALVGQSVGAKNREDARAYGTLAGIAGFLLCSATGLALFFLARPLAGLFTTDQAVIDQAALVLRIVSVSEPFFAAFIVLSGALRGAHDVRFPMFLALFCMWGVRVVCAPILVLYWMWAWRASGPPWRPISSSAACCAPFAGKVGAGWPRPGWSKCSPESDPARPALYPPRQQVDFPRRRHGRRKSAASMASDTKSIQSGGHRFRKRWPLKIC